jgi:uncharacterized protein (DUF697 family)
MKQVGIKLGVKLSQQAVKKIPFEIIKQINQKVGFRLLTKFGETGIINIGKAVPIAGGVISATIDAFSTHSIGKVSKKLFIP